MYSGIVEKENLCLDGAARALYGVSVVDIYGVGLRIVAINYTPFSRRIGQIEQDSNLGCFRVAPGERMVS